jgi:hypothetical protein
MSTRHPPHSTTVCCGSSTTSHTQQQHVESPHPISGLGLGTPHSWHTWSSRSSSNRACRSASSPIAMATCYEQGRAGQGQHVNLFALARLWVSQVAHAPTDPPHLPPRRIAPYCSVTLQQSHLGVLDALLDHLEHVVLLPHHAPLHLQETCIFQLRGRVRLAWGDLLAGRPTLQQRVPAAARLAVGRGASGQEVTRQWTTRPGLNDLLQPGDCRGMGQVAYRHRVNQRLEGSPPCQAPHDSVGQRCRNKKQSNYK